MVGILQILSTNCQPIKNEWIAGGITGLPLGTAEGLKHSISSLFDGKYIRERAASGSKRLIEMSLNPIEIADDKHT